MVTAAVTILPSINDVWSWLAQIPDPEVPSISIVDLGIVRDVEFRGDLCVVTVTPTYSGCPATEVIAQNIRQALTEHGIAQCQLQTRLSPPWTTDWMSDAAKEKLREYGIAPPTGSAADALVTLQVSVACPRCGSTRTHRISQFGSTACKALYACDGCLEPFDYFKGH